MNLNISQDNLYMLLPGKMATIAGFYSEDNCCTMLEALRHLYSSPMYEKLSDVNSGLWQLGATTLYEELK